MREQFCFYCMEPRSAEDRLCAHCHKPTLYEAPAHHLKPGTLLRDKYMVGRALGEGGFGITYLGRDTTLDMRIAVKEYYPNGYSNRNHNFSNEVTLTQNGSDQDFEADMQRFLREARMLAKFSDEPGIVGVRDFFRENGTAYIVMEYLDGITLKEHLQTNGTIPVRQLLDMIGPVLLSLDRIHKEGMIHRDISPDNIMLLKNGSLKLLDFGAAREVKGDKSLSVVLKPGYAPEEQYRTKGNQGPWTDVYAMAATIYKCITGVTPDESLERVYDDSLQPPSKLGVAIAPKQEAALLQGMNVRVRDRLQSARELWQGLQPARDEEAVQSVQIQRQAEETGTVSVSAEKAEQKTVYQPVHPAPMAEVKPMAAPAAPKAESKTVCQPAPQPAAPEKKAKAPVPMPKKKKSRKPLLFVGGGLAAALLLVVVLVLVLGGAGEKVDVQVTSVPGSGAYSLEAVGQIQDANRDMIFRNNMLHMESADGGYILLDSMGNDATGKRFEASEDLGRNLYAVREVSDEVNSVGLLTGDGKYLIGAEAALIQWPYGCNKETCRYLLVYYAETETTDTENFVVCYTENGSYSSAVSDGRLYTGYIRVYDLETETFVPEIPALYSLLDMSACGNSLLIRNADGSSTLYSADGQILLELPGGSNTVGDGIFVNYSDGTYRVYDETGTQTYYANKTIAVVGKSPYIMMSTDGRYTVMDASGNKVLEQTYEMVTDVIDGMFKVKNDGKYGLVTADGTEFLACQYTAIEPILPGYGYMTTGDDYHLYGPEGIIAAGMDYSATDLIVVNEENQYYVLNSRSYALQMHDAYHDVLQAGLAVIESDETGLYGVYDLISGNPLLSSQYEQVACANGKLYAFKNGSWEIYEITFS